MGLEGWKEEHLRRKKQLFSDENVEEQGEGSGAVGLPIWAMCEGEQAQKNGQPEE